MADALARAWSLHQAGERAAAERAYGEILALDPTQADTLNCYGILLMQSGRPDEAYALFRRAVASDAKQAPFQLNVARAALRIGRAEAALEASDAALELASSANAWLLRGVALRDLDRALDARAAFRKGAQKFPDDYALAYNLAVSEMDAGNPQAAAMQFERLLATRPNDARGWVGLGNARAAAQSLDGAEAAYRQALTLAPRLPEAWRLLGLVQIQRGKPRPASEALRRGLMHEPRDQAALAALAVAASQCGDDIARRLLDFDRIVHTAIFASDIDVEALTAEILAQPSLRYDRNQKTTRDGGQTGNLVEAATPALATFVARLHEEAAARIAAAAERFERDAHPLARTQPQRWQINLWATVLKEQGRQAPHLHPSGWLSGVYYVAVPDICETSEAGWLEFGRPPAELTIDETLPMRRLLPRAGELTTFPSYLYHRTVPHVGREPRISLAFDVVPLD
jgi:uncharacterized protein (TIGR02466 family)